MELSNALLQASRRGALSALAIVAAAFCGQCGRDVEPVIEFTRLPPAGEGGPDRTGSIEGRAKGVRPGQKVVLYARSGVWWVQPFANQPFTEIGPDFKWKNLTHPGTAYAALLVKPGFQPPPTMTVLPEKGPGVVAVKIADAAMLARPPAKLLRFGGYEWEIRQTATNSGGTLNQYDPANAWTDNSGYLHFRIAKQPAGWTSAEIVLTQSLGFGSYLFVVRDISQFEPSAVLSLSIRDNSAPPREADIEISRWGELNSKNAQFVVQPYYVPQNSVRFAAPAGRLAHYLRWEPNRLSFQTAQVQTPRGARTSRSANGAPVATHVFTSGIPVSGTDSIHLNLYVFGNQRNPLQRETEVVIEKFEFLP